MMKIKYCEPEGYYSLGQGRYAEISADSVLTRLSAATGTKTQMELAEWLCVSQSQISDVKRRNIIPAKWLYLLLERRTWYNPVWGLTGRGEAYSEEWWYTIAGLRAAIPVSYKS